VDLEGKAILVTGGASGIGLAVVRRLLSEGCKIGVVDIVQTPDQDVSGTGEVDFYSCDITDIERVQEVVNCFSEKHGRVHGLVNNAGILHSEPLVGFSIDGIRKHEVEAWSRVIDCNLNSVFYMGVSVAEKMLKTRTKGVIINISSICASGNPGQGAYSAAKAGVNALTRSWARELGPMGIRVGGVAPGFTDIPSTSRALSVQMLKETVSRVPLRRLANVEEIADGVCFGLKNDFFNGRILEIDGGLPL
jgi:3-oxoacyl-[acyl-carrier protein] reductase